MRNFFVLLALLGLAGAYPAEARVYRSDAEALREAFAEADSVVERAVSLAEEERSAVEVELGCALSDLLVGPRTRFTFHEGLRDGKPYRYAMALTVVARSEEMRYLVVLSAEGVVESVELLAFHEPSMYRPSKKFLAQLRGATPAALPEHRRNVRNLTGATITSRRTARAVRLVLLLAERHVLKTASKH